MLCVPIVGPTLKEVERQITEATPHADMLEFLFDRYHEEIFPNVPLPVIFTFTSLDLPKILKLLQLKPDYIQIDSTAPPSFIAKIKKEFPNIKLIITYHNFETTPDLESCFKTFLPGADIYKVAVMSRSSLDGLEMLKFMKHHQSLLGISMGEKGSFTRILGLIFGAPWTFASLSDEEKTAPGQIPCQELKKIYQPKRLSKSTQIFALIGENVTHSLSHFSHNKVMQERIIDGVYVKISITPLELESFFSYAKTLPFKGLSVTMPLKEKVLPFLTHIDPEAEKIGAVNTITFKDNTLTGYNTDGIGALNAIEKRLLVQGKKVVILGAGGAAKAIIFEAIKRGADVIILNRTEQRAKELATKWNCKWGCLEDLNQFIPYNVLINTTPADHPVDEKVIQEGCIAMDIRTIPVMTPFLEMALKRNCTLVFGHEMFILQGIEQYKRWLPSEDPTKIAPIFEKEVLSHLTIRYRS